MGGLESPTCKQKDCGTCGQAGRQAGRFCFAGGLLACLLAAPAPSCHPPASPVFWLGPFSSLQLPQLPQLQSSRSNKSVVLLRARRSFYVHVHVCAARSPLFSIQQVMDLQFSSAHIIARHYSGVTNPIDCPVVVCQDRIKPKLITETTMADTVSILFDSFYSLPCAVT